MYSRYTDLNRSIVISQDVDLDLGCKDYLYNLSFNGSSSESIIESISSEASTASDAQCKVFMFLDDDAKNTTGNDGFFNKFMKIFCLYS